MFPRDSPGASGLAERSMVAATEFETAGVVVAGRPVIANRVLNAVSIGVPLAGSLFACLSWLASGRLAPTGTTLAIFLVCFVLELLGLGVGLHRYFTHRAFRTAPWLRAVLGVLGSSAFQGPIDRWVADHRRHHRFADQPLDPHSPHWIDGEPPRWKWLGLVHAHLTWMFTCPLSDPDRYAADIRRDPISRWCSRRYWWLAGAGLLAPALVGFAAGGAHEAALGFFWAGCVRVTLLQHLTWSINSLGHSFGRQVEGARDQSRDITFFSLVLFGEGFHSYHHLHPSAAINQPAQLDLGGLVLRGLERLGLVWDLRRAD